MNGRTRPDEILLNRSVLNPFPLSLSVPTLHLYLPVPYGRSNYAHFSLVPVSLLLSRDRECEHDYTCAVKTQDAPSGFHRKVLQWRLMILRGAITLARLLLISSQTPYNEALNRRRNWEFSLSLTLPPFTPFLSPYLFLPVEDQSRTCAFRFILRSKISNEGEGWSFVRRVG